MNKQAGIYSYKDLLAEKARLEQLIENQKNIIRHDLDELKQEFRKEIKPAVDAANFVKKFARKETRNDTMLSFGAALLTNTVSKLAFRKSNLLFQIVGPKLVRMLAAKFLKHP